MTNEKTLIFLITFAAAAMHLVVLVVLPHGPSGAISLEVTLLILCSVKVLHSSIDGFVLNNS